MMRALPVLMYHHVNPNQGDTVTITPEEFESHLRHIVESGFRSLSLDETVGFVNGTFIPEKRAVAITFDDGYLDNYVFAYPLLKKYCVKATVFLVTSWVDGASEVSGKETEEAVKNLRENHPDHRESKRLISEGGFHRVSVNWDMAREMHSSGLVGIYSHTVTHKSCDSLSWEELGFELEKSKKNIEERLRTRCEYLCWPRGRFNNTAVEAAKEAGYTALLTTRHGVTCPGDDPLGIKRIVVKEGRNWLKKRLSIYSNAFFSKLYLKMSGKG